MTSLSVKPAERACPGCRSDGRALSEYHFRDPDDYFKEPLRFVSCASCHLVYLAEPLKAEPLYFSDYYGTRRGLPSYVFEPFNRYWVSVKAQRFARLIDGKTVLDFGCGRGDFLGALETLGFDVWGVETQKDAVAALRAKRGSHIASRVTDLPTTPDLFDGITLWHVLEHVDDPSTILNELNRVSKKGGKLFVAVPNWDSWERHFFGDRWFHLDVPRHQLQFTQETVSALLATCGWQIVSVSYSGWAYNLYGLFQSLLNLGPGPRNFFYRLCKRGVFMPLSNSRFWIGAAWNLVAILPAAVIAMVLIGPLTALHKTGTIELVAVKKSVEKTGH